MTEGEKQAGLVRIRQAAVEILLEVGVRAATTRMVTDRAGVGRGLLNHYYRWSQLRAEAWSEIFDKMLDEQPASAMQPDELIEAYFASAFDDSSRIYWALWLDAVDLAKTDSALASATGRIHRKMFAKLAGYLTDGAAKGLWQIADARATAVRLSALYDGLAGMLLTGTTDLTPTEAEGHLRQLFLLETGKIQA